MLLPPARSPFLLLNAPPRPPFKCYLLPVTPGISSAAETPSSEPPGPAAFAPRWPYSRPAPAPRDGRLLGGTSQLSSLSPSQLHAQGYSRGHAKSRVIK